MKASTKRFLLIFGYIAVVAWIVPALCYSVNQGVEQHHIFSYLRTIRYSNDHCSVDAASRDLGKFGLEGLIYIIQELKQDEERDRRIKLANILDRFVVADSDKSRWGWGEEKALRELLAEWPASPGRNIDVQALRPDRVKKLLTNLKLIGPSDRETILSFAIEYALVAMHWKPQDDLKLLQSKRERIKFMGFLDLVRAEQLKFRPFWAEDKPAVELNGDQMRRAEDFLDDWVDKEAEKIDTQRFSEQYAQGERLEHVLLGDRVAFSEEDCDKMIDLLTDWQAESVRLSPEAVPAIYCALKEKLHRFADGVPVNFSGEDRDNIRNRLIAFKDDYISHAVEVKFRNTVERELREYSDRGIAPIDTTPEERAVAVKVGRKCRREYAYARVKMARTACSIVRNLTAKKERFQILVQDIPKDQGVFRQLSQSWRAKNDEIVMIDLIQLLHDDDFGVRVNISDALVSIGEPAIFYLVKQLKRERVSSTAVVRTRDKTRAEREKELNRKNTQARREVAMILSRIGSARAEEALKLMTKDPVIGNTVHEALKRFGVKQRKK